MKFYWNTALHVHLHFINGYFLATTVELSSGNGDCIYLQMPKIFSLWAFKEKVCQPLQYNMQKPSGWGRGSIIRKMVVTLQRR